MRTYIARKRHYPVKSMLFVTLNRRTQTKLANGSTENYTYDVANQLTAIVYKKADGTTVIGDLSYTYDANGRRKSMGGSLARVTASLATSISTATYDANNRLTKWGGSTAASQSTLSYDANGRRSSKAILNGTTTTITGFAYDGANFIQELNKAGTGTSPNTTADIKATLLTAGVDEALARMSGTGSSAQILSIATDGNNNTLHTSDQSQVQNTAYTYEAYGRATSTNSTDSNTQQYTGRELDIKSSATAPANNNPLNSGGLMYYRARYYLPGCARFISEDPIGWASGQTNGYAYVGGDPVSFRDPNGLTVTVLGGAIIGAGVGAFVGGIGAYMTCGNIGAGIATGALTGGTMGALAGLGITPGLGAWIGAGMGTVGNLLGQMQDIGTPDFAPNYGGAIGAAVGGAFGGGISGAANVMPKIPRQAVTGTTGPGGKIAGEYATAGPGGMGDVIGTHMGATGGNGCK